ncbi:RNase H domain-containing protein [Trichonephila clavipes]|nr:RNase H domain-containing protein [Trichonephila clavipes]
MECRRVTAYIDGSSDSECNRGGSGVFLKYPDNTTSKHEVSAGQIASNFTCELIAIRTALDIYLTRTNIANSDGIIVLSDCRFALEAIKEGKMGLIHEINLFLHWCIGQIMYPSVDPAHIDIEGNEMADLNEARTLEPLTSSTTVVDANAVVAKQTLCSNPRKKLSLPELNYSGEITSTKTRLRSKHFKDMMILSNGSRSYVECRHCPGPQLGPKHLFSCPSIVGALFKIDNDCSMDILYSDRTMDVATEVHAFGNSCDYILMYFIETPAPCYTR